MPIILEPEAETIVVTTAEFYQFGDKQMLSLIESVDGHDENHVTLDPSQLAQLRDLLGGEACEQPSR